MPWVYDRCSSCPNTHRQVMPRGPQNADIMLIGEGPGKNEDLKGVPFVGQSGQELDNTYLHLADLDRQDIFVTNCVQCRCERNGQDIKPADELTKICSTNHLPEEILTVWPKVIVLCGATACSLLPDIDLETEHGFPRPADLFGWHGTVIPMYHPAAGMHEPTRYMIPLLEDWRNLGKWMRGKWNPPVSTTRQDYRLLRTSKEFWECIEEEPNPYEHLPIDSESDEGRLYSVQFSTQPGKAFMILLDNVEVISEFACWFEWNYNGAVLHNAPYDLEELRSIIEPRSIRDTMQELYALGNLPQGLKQAVYRLFGHRMISYDEVVTPYSKAVLEGWLAEALGCVSTEMRTLHTEQLKTKVRETWKPHESESTLRRIMGKLSDPASDYDPWEKPKISKGMVKPRLIGRDWLPTIEAAIGRMPRKSIVHAPIEQQIQYACSDADWTGRLATKLESERKRIVQEEWSVAS